MIDVDKLLDELEQSARFADLVRTAHQAGDLAGAVSDMEDRISAIDSTLRDLAEPEPLRFHDAPTPEPEDRPDADGYRRIIRTLHGYIASRCIPEALTQRVLNFDFAALGRSSDALELVSDLQKHISHADTGE